MLIAFVAYPWIIDFLLHPYKDLVEARPNSSITGGQLLQTDPLEGFGVRMKTSAYAGIALAMPVILWQMWKFVTPGLYPNGEPLGRAVRAQRAGAVRPGRRRWPTSPCPGRSSSWSTSPATTSSRPSRPASTSSWSPT